MEVEEKERERKGKWRVKKGEGEGSEWKERGKRREVWEIWIDFPIDLRADIAITKTNKQTNKQQTKHTFWLPIFHKGLPTT